MVKNELNIFTNVGVCSKVVYEGKICHSACRIIFGAIDRHCTVAKMMLQVQKAENSKLQTKIIFVGSAKFCP